MTSQLAESRLAETNSIHEKTIAATAKWMPSELSFEEIIKNNPLPPCSLNDFMDYLVHIEQNAETLQFFLWFCDYIQRWVKLCPKQRALSRPWKHAGIDIESPYAAMTIDSSSLPTIDGSTSSRRPQGHQRSTSQKLEAILQILEQECDKERANGRREDSTKSMDTAISEASFSPISSERRNHSRRPSRSKTSRSGSQSMCLDESIYGNNNMTFTIQPFRDELSRVVRHYIAPLSTSTPRPMFLLSPEARVEVHRASQQTTHPSSVLPALEVAETAVRASHPNFILWAVRNANPPRLHFWLLLGTICVIIGVLTVSLCAALVRIDGELWLWMVRATVASFLWWPGTMVAFAASKGICLVRFTRGTRDVRPWELDNSSPEPPVPSSGGKAVDDDASETIDLESGFGRWSQWKKPSMRASTSTSGGSSCRGETAHSLGGMSVQTGNSKFDPLRKGTMQTFGPANDHTKDMDCWQGMSIWRKIFVPEVPVPEDCQTRRLQRRAVMRAGIWAVVVTALLVLGSAFIPRSR
ncbi:regulator of G protein-like protein [Zalerion maritima]|uniref:Regulator of G protein-like protein n=1 Tax=Zalerion maritima TaxID=339359 RepID=A0AAD5WT77_9PEZI|nr:regulator of G protein-like protein [Zalerion maritima]